MYVLGFDIGGTKCAVTTARWENGEVTLLEKAACPTDLSISPRTMMEKLMEMADGILTEPPVSVGISCGGPLDSNTGVILGPPNLPGWDEVPIVEWLREHYGVTVNLQNDANGNVITLGTIDNAAVFTAVEPTFSYDEASKIFSESEQDKLVRFKRTDNVWINTQQPAQLAKYNTGTGTFTIHFAYELTEVEKFTADFTKAEYASFYAPGSVTIPEGVEAYYLTNEGFNGDHVTLTKIDGGIIPALTAVILKSNNDEVIDLSVTEESSTEDLSANLFKGTVVKRHIQVEESGAYVLGIADEEVGLYKSNKTAITNTYTIHVFLNNANKAYLPASAVPATANNPASFSFRFGEGTTGISEVKGENGEVKVIYDLTGRKVETISAPGIYIVNGVKRVVR